MKVQALRSVSTWREAALTLAALTAEFTSPGREGRQEVIALARAVGCLDVAGLPAEPGRLRRLMSRLLRATSLSSGNDHRRQCRVTRLFSR